MTCFSHSLRTSLLHMSYVSCCFESRCASCEHGAFTFSPTQVSRAETMVGHHAVYFHWLLFGLILACSHLGVIRRLILCRHIMVSQGTISSRGGNMHERILSSGHMRILYFSFDGGTENVTKLHSNSCPGLSLGAFCTIFRAWPV